MKVRKMKKRTWCFYSNHNRENRVYKSFKYKRDLMKYLENNIEEAICGTVCIKYDNYRSSGTFREYFVWYNDYNYKYKNEKFKVVLKEVEFRGRKYYTNSKTIKISKESKKWFCFSEKVITLMSAIENNKNDDLLKKRQLKNLIELFYKRGYKDITYEYANEHYNCDDYLNLTEEIPYSYWCDRCNDIRCYIIIEVYKKVYGDDL